MGARSPASERHKELVMDDELSKRFNRLACGLAAGHHKKEFSKDFLSGQPQHYHRAFLYCGEGGPFRYESHAKTSLHHLNGEFGISRRHSGIDTPGINPPLAKKLVNQFPGT